MRFSSPLPEVAKPRQPSCGGLGSERQLAVPFHFSRFLPYRASLNAMYRRFQDRYGLETTRLSYSTETRALRSMSF